MRTGNTAHDAGEQDRALAAAAQVRAMMAVLGLDPYDPHWASETGEETGALGALVTAALAERTRARAERDWARADEIRDLLAAGGITITDGPEGATWSVSHD